MSASGSKDMFSSRVTQNKSVKETLTPHRISVIVFIRDFCDIKKTYRDGTDDNGTANQALTSSNRRCFAILALKLIQGEDMEMSELQALITAQKELLLDIHLEKFEASLSSLYTEGVANLQDLVQGLGSYLTEPTHLSPIVNRTSVIGIFFRRMMVLFDKLSFSQVVSTFQSFKEYFEKYSRKISPSSQPSEAPTVENEATKSSCNESKLSVNDLSLLEPISKEPAEESREVRQWTRRQAELFISQQANLIQTNGMETMSPQELQQKITDLLKANPDYAEAHYLSFLNCVRAKEFCGAIDSLFHCFDRNTLISDTKLTTQEEKSRGSRYAALNLAVLYAQFGHKKEALSALKSAIMLAHENNDNVCLQHALAWLHKLCDKNKEVLMERLISKSSDLNLCHLTSLGIQSFAHYAAISAGKPALVFDLLMKSDALNCQHSMTDLMCNSFALKSALWCMYGKTNMMSISSQLLLHLDTSNPSLGTNEYNGEGACQAICNIANIFLDKGEFKNAHTVLENARGRFPHEPTSHIWMICEQVMLFTHAIHQEKWQDAEQAVVQLRPLDRVESQLRKVELYIAKGEYTSASSSVYRLLDSGLANDDTVCPTLRARAFIHAAEIQCYSSSIVKTPSVGINLFLSSLKFTQLHHLDYLTAIVGFHMASVQFQMGLPTQGLKLVDQFMLTILTNGGAYDKGRALLLMVKCNVAATAGSAPDTRQKALENAISTLNKVKDFFTKAESFSRVKDVLYLQALIFNDMGNDTEKNRCAWEYRQLDEHHPTKIATTLLTRL